MQHVLFVFAPGKIVPAPAKIVALVHLMGMSGLAPSTMQA